MTVTLMYPHCLVYTTLEILIFWISISRVLHEVTMSTQWCAAALQLKNQEAEIRHIGCHPSTDPGHHSGAPLEFLLVQITVVSSSCSQFPCICPSHPPRWISFWAGWRHAVRVCSPTRWRWSKPACSCRESSRAAAPTRFSTATCSTLFTQSEK